MTMTMTNAVQFCSAVLIFHINQNSKHCRKVHKVSQHKKEEKQSEY